MLEKEDKISKTSQPYHHGNVKEALIDTGLKFIRANQLELISLRKLSKEVGVTPSAVYNHFADKNALLVAIKIRVYDQFNNYFLDRLTHPEDPEKALMEVCKAYYDYSSEFPSQFNFLFSSVLPAEWSTPELVEISCRGLVFARSMMLRLYERYQIQCSEEELVNATMLLWSQLHGIVTLKNSGSIQAAVRNQEWPERCALKQDDEVEGIISQHVKTLVSGIRNRTQDAGKH